MTASYSLNDKRIIFNNIEVMNPRASDRVRGIQDTIIVVGDVRSILKLGAEIDITLSQYLLSSLVT